MKALDLGNIIVAIVAIAAWTATIVTGHSDPAFSNVLSVILGASGGHALTRAVS